MPIAEKKIYTSVGFAGGVRSRPGALSPGQIGRAGPAPPGLSRFRPYRSDNGVAVTTSTFTYLATGGIIFAGAAVLAKVKNFLPTGGIVFSGAAPLAKVKSYLPSGGIVFSGTALLAKIKSFLSSGGILFAGTAPVAKVKVPTVAGGVVFSGTAPTSFQAAGSGPAVPPMKTLVGAGQ